MRGHVHVVRVGGPLLLLLLGPLPLLPLVPLGGHLHPGELAGAVVLPKGLHLEDVLPAVVPKVLCLRGKFNITPRFFKILAFKILAFKILDGITPRLLNSYERLCHEEKKDEDFPSTLDVKAIGYSRNSLVMS